MEIERARLESMLKTLMNRKEEVKKKPIPKHAGLDRDYVIAERSFWDGGIAALKLLLMEKPLLDTDKMKNLNREMLEVQKIVTEDCG